MNITLEKGIATVKDMLLSREYTDISVSKNIIRCDKLMAFFSKEPKITINHIKEFIALLDDEGYNHGIFIYPNTITPSAKKAIDVIDKTVELFELTEVQYNITAHRLVPRHEKLTGLIYQEIKVKYGKSIPYMLSTDPISRYYRYRKGDIIKIERKEGVIYRIVI
jgi:DNA-directed RNA polymerase I, II, and III subunit RPABC1